MHAYGIFISMLLQLREKWIATLPQVPQLQVGAKLLSPEHGASELLQVLAELMFSQEVRVLFLQPLLVQLQSARHFYQLLQLSAQLLVLYSNALSVLLEALRGFLE